MTVAPAKLAWAVQLRDSGHTIADIVTQTGIPRTSLYRHLPPRPPDQHTAAPAPAETAAGPDPLAASTAREDTP